MMPESTPPPGAAARPRSVSVVIRNRNEAATLRHVLASLAVQADPADEIVVVDNGSTDDSRDVAAGHGCRIVHLPPEQFTYGRALNVGIAAATGECIVVLSAHAMPVGRWFLTECRAALDDPAVAAARCLYVGKAADATRWLAPERLAGTDLPVGEVVSKGPLASGCVLRRAVWAELPFDEGAAGGEDKLWAIAVLRRGHAILSPIPAPYAYLRRMPALRELRKLSRERAAVYRATGFGATPVRQTLRDLAYDVSVGAGRAFASAVQLAVVRASERLLLPRRAARAHRAGPLQ